MRSRPTSRARRASRTGDERPADEHYKSGARARDSVALVPILWGRKSSARRWSGRGRLSGGLAGRPRALHRLREGLAAMRRVMAPGRGFEPRYATSKAAVLPLNEPGDRWRKAQESNLPTLAGSLGLASRRNATLPAFRWWRGEDSNLQCYRVGHRFTACCVHRSATAPRNGRAGGGRTHRISPV